VEAELLELAVEAVEQVEFLRIAFNDGLTRFFRCLFRPETSAPSRTDAHSFGGESGEPALNTFVATSFLHRGGFGVAGEVGRSEGNISSGSSESSRPRPTTEESSASSLGGSMPVKTK
jgi:hypothetical protein